VPHLPIGQRKAIQALEKRASWILLDRVVVANPKVHNVRGSLVSRQLGDEFKGGVFTFPNAQRVKHTQHGVARVERDVDAPDQQVSRGQARSNMASDIFDERVLATHRGQTDKLWGELRDALIDNFPVSSP